MQGPEPWYAKGLQFSCRRCGRCCRVHGDYAYVYLAGDEAERIGAHLGLASREFEQRYCKRLEGYRVLRFQGEECCFLDGDACRVYPVRPLQCRTWPFWSENLDEWVWSEEVAEICPGVNRGRLHTAGEIRERAGELERRFGSEVEA